MQVFLYFLYRTFFSTEVIHALILPVRVTVTGATDSQENSLKISIELSSASGTECTEDINIISRGNPADFLVFKIKNYKIVWTKIKFCVIITYYSLR